MSSINVSDVSKYALRRNDPRGVLGLKTLYNSLQYGVRRLDGSIPGSVTLSPSGSDANYPSSRAVSNNCGCGS